MTDIDRQRRLIVEEAHTWLRTRYHHQQRLKGVGVDCVWLLIKVYELVIPELASFDPGNYSGDWYLHKEEEIYMGGLERFSRRLPGGVKPQIGDVAAYKIGYCVSHGAILVGDDMVIHANRLARQVELTRLQDIEQHFHSYWSPFIWAGET